MDITLSARFDKLREKRWTDDYFLRLAIMSHIREVMLLEDRRLVHNTADNNDDVEKEMADLFILLSMWIYDDPKLLSMRLDKFLEKAKMYHLRQNLE